MATIAGVLTVLMSMGVCVAAVLGPAPAATVPLVVSTSVGCPLFAGWEVRPAIDSCRAERARHRALASLRAALARLLKTEHPLGL